MSSIPSFTDEDTSRFADVELAGTRLKLHFNDCGPRSSSAGIVLMLHGSGPGSRGWASFSRNAQHLVANGYRTLLIDLPGWGRSDSIICREARPELNARAVAGLLNELGIDEPVDLVGSSMGAHSAVALALLHPRSVRKLVLSAGGTSGISMFQAMPTEGIRLMQALYRDPTRQNLKGMLTAFLYDSSGISDQVIDERLSTILERTDHLNNFIESFASHPDQYPDYGPRLSEVTASTLIVWGRDDRFVPLDMGLRLVAGIPKAELIVFGRCGHGPHAEHWSRFNRVMLDFLES